MKDLLVKGDYSTDHLKTVRPQDQRSKNQTPQADY